MEARTQTKPLDVRQPLSSRSQPLKLIAKTADNKLVLQGLVTHQVFTVDTYGRRIGSNNQPSDVQFVFNAASPDDVPSSKVRSDLKVGDLVYCLRPLSRHCKVHVGTVDGFVAGSTKIRVAPASRARMANKDGASKKEVIKAPNAVVFKNAAAIRTFLDQFDEDLETAAKLFDALNGARS